MTCEAFTSHLSWTARAALQASGQRLTPYHKASRATQEKSANGHFGQRCKTESRLTRRSLFCCVFTTRVNCPAIPGITFRPEKYLTRSSLLMLSRPRVGSPHGAFSLAESRRTTLTTGASRPCRVGTLLIEPKLDIAFDEGGFAARAAILRSARLRRRRRDEPDHLKQTFGLERLGHTDNRAEIVARGVVRRRRAARHQHNGHARQSLAVLDDQAEIVSGRIAEFHFRDEARRNRRAQDVERRGAGSNDENIVALRREQGLQLLLQFWIGLRGQDHGPRDRSLHWRSLERRGCAVCIRFFL